MPINLFEQHFVETVVRADGIIHIAMVNDLPQYSMQDYSGNHWIVVGRMARRHRRGAADPPLFQRHQGDGDHRVAS